MSTFGIQRSDFSVSVLRVFLACVLLVLVPVAVQAKDYSAERFDARIEVLNGGALRVTETIVIRFEEGTFTFFYRTLPTRKTDGIDFVSASMDGRMFPVGDGPGQVEVRRKDGLRIEWNFPKTPPSTHTFELTYVAKGVALADDARDVIAWRALPSDHDYRIASSRIELVFPMSPVDPVSIDTRRVDSVHQSQSDTSFVVNASGIGKNGWVELSANLPKGSVVDAVPAWQQRGLQHQTYRQPSVIAAALVFLAGLILLFAIRQSYDSPPPDIQTPHTFSGPPDSSPPAVAGALTSNGSVRFEHAMGALFALAADGALTIHEMERGVFGQRKFGITRGRARRPLAKHEETLIDEIFHAKGASEREVPLDRARSHLHSHFSKFKSAMESEMTAAGLFDSGRRQVRRRYNVLGVTFLVLSLAAAIPCFVVSEIVGPWPFVVPLAIGILAITSFMFAAAHTPLANEGVRRGEAWRAYQKQLRDVPKDITRADWSRGVHSPADLLPLAVALGLAAGWSKIFKDSAAQLPSWFHAASAADANTGFVAFVGHGGSGVGGGSGGGGGAAGGGGSGAG